MTLLKYPLIACLTSVLVACGGSIGHDKPTPNLGESSSSSSSSASSNPPPNSGSNTLQGVFLDSPVVNIQYDTESQSGVTDEHGQYKYLPGETVVFSIGDLSFPPVSAMGTVTPLEILGTNDINADAVVNMARLLQTLDVDGDPSNGITIDDQAHGAATQFDFDVDQQTFEESSAVINLISGSGSSQTTLVDGGDAVAHLQSTLDNHVHKRVVVSADGSGNTYELFNSGFGGTAVESPVCDYEDDSFGRRITDEMDDILEEYVFAFHILRDVDGDRCMESITDRQRIEVKTYGASPADRVASQGQTHTYRWKFKLDDGFQPSSSFTHIFQIKVAGGSDDGMPVITFTPRAGNPDTLEVLHSAGSDSSTDLVASAELAEFEGQWVEAYVRTRYDNNGSFEVNIRRLSDGEELVSWYDNDIDMWRDGADIGRPKWGIYRSLNNINVLRDETVWFNDFCIAEGTNTCPSALDPVTQPPVDDEAPDYGFESEAVGDEPEGFDVEGDITVSDERAREGSQSLKLSHPDDNQVRLRQMFGATETGTLKASIFIPDDVGVDTLITLYADSYVAAERVIDLIFKPDGELRRREGTGQESVMPYTQGDWTDIEIQWNDVANSSEFTLLVNGTEVGTFPAANPGLIPERVEFKYGQNSGAVTDKDMFLDAITIADSIGDNGDNGSDGPTDDPDYSFETDALGSQPNGFEIEGDIQVSDERASHGNQSVKFSHLVDGQVRMRREWGPTSSGSVKASVYIPSDVGVDSLITVYAEQYNSVNRSIDILFKPGGELRRREGSSQENVTSYIFDDWNDIEIEWTDIDVTNEFTLTVNGVEMGTFPTATAGLVPERVEFKFGGNAGAITDKSIYLDAVSAF